MGNKIDINLSESAKAKKQCHSLPYSVLRIRNDQWKHFKYCFPPDSNPKMGKKGVTKLLLIYVKEPKVKITDIVYLRLLRVRTDQCKYLKLALPLTATQKGVIKRGKKIDIYLCKKAMLKPVSYRTLGFQSTE